MTRDLNMPDRDDLSLEEAALGALSPEAQAALEARLARDADAARELVALRASVAAMAFSAQPAPVARSVDPVRARLLARASAEAASATRNQAMPSASVSPALAVSPAPPVATPRPVADVVPIRSRTPWIVVGAAVLAAAASLLLVMRTQVERSGLRDRVSTLTASQVAAQSQLDSLTRLLSEREQQLASVTGPDVAVVELASTSALPPSGRMFWDRASDRWTFIASNLPALAPDRAFQLWLITANERILAGAFTADANGVAVVRAEYDLPRDALVAVAVTEEPASGVPQPTGDIIIVGNAPAGDTR